MRAMRHPPQDEEEDQSLEDCLVKLAGVARRGFDARVLVHRFRKHHAPRYRRRPSEQLAIYEVRDAAEEQAYWHRSRTHVHWRPGRQAIATCERNDGNTAANKRAVEGHAAAPDLHNLQRMREIVERLVKENEAKPPAQYDAERHEKEKVIRLLYAERRLSRWPEGVISYEPPYIKPADE